MNRIELIQEVFKITSFENYLEMKYDLLASHCKKRLIKMGC